VSDALDIGMHPISILDIGRYGTDIECPNSDTDYPFSN
jgi:hypothetical protein